MRRPVTHPGLAAALFLVCLARAASAASFPPDLRFRSLVTPHVTVHYHQGLETLAREAATLADTLLAAHEARYAVKVGRVQVVLADVEDDSNGFATPLPYPLVHVRAVAPRGADEFGNHDGWLRLVLSHELAHVVHLEQAHGALRLGRKVLGRAPFLFPNGATPTWMIEGLATYEETEMTAFGRGENPDVRMVLRMEAVERGLPHADEPVGGLDRWPGGSAAYLFGESFLRYLTRRFGSDTLPRLARVHAGRVIPYLDDRTAREVTGASMVKRWEEWRRDVGAELQAEAEGLSAPGLTPSRPLTTRGVRQYGARYSPRGDVIAYTNRSLTRYRAIHLVGADGTGDRRLTRRHGGSALSWTADGRRIVFDEPDVYRRFRTWFDLRVVDVASGRSRALTRGLRAKEPDVSRDGTVVFVRQEADRSELALVGLDGGAPPRDLTRSEPGTQWSNPRWSPSGDTLLAARLLPGGWLDLVRVDPATGALSELTHDRAKDVEPAFTPDGAEVVFRSDRDGVSNLYGLRLADGRLRRLTNVLGGAFAPDVSPDGRHVAFAHYAARGYDVHVMDVPADEAPLPVPAFRDQREPPPAPPPPVAIAEQAYSTLPHLRPRFWSPYVAGSAGEVRIGAVTGGADPIFRHAYGVDVHANTRNGNPGAQAFYQYDRFVPTLLAVVEDTRDRLADGVITRDRSLTVRASVPLVRRLRWSQSLSLAWRRERETLENGRGTEALDFGGLEASWSLTTARQYPYSISPIDGARVRVSFLKEDPALGSEVSLGKLTGDVRAYTRVLGESDTLAVAAGGGATYGGGAAAARSFAIGGFPDGSLLDVFRTNHAVLRGYEDRQFRGRNFAHANLEYRFPLGHPQRGFRTLPAFVRHLHGAVFADAGHAWTNGFRVRDVKTSAGLALGADFYLAHALPFTGTVGFAQGLSRLGESQFYVRAGLSF